LLGWCGLLFFPGLTASELYRTESLRAIVAQQCLRGDWLVPTLYGEPFVTKPPGAYVAIALCSLPAGRVTDATARLPSALAATATVLLLAGHFRRQLGPPAGWVVGLTLPVSLLWLDKAPSAEIDMLQVFWVTAAVVCFLRAVEAQGGGRGGLGWWLLALLAVAGGLLTKWTAPAFFYLTAVPFLWARGRLRLLIGWRHLLAVGVAAGLCLLWVALAVARVGGDLFFDTVRQQALNHLAPEHNGKPYPWLGVLSHPLFLLAVHMPASGLALLTLRPGFAKLWDGRGRWMLQACHAWVWPNLLFWSVLPEHAARYSMPIAPGFAGLAAFVWVGWLWGRRPNPPAPFPTREGGAQGRSRGDRRQRRALWPGPPPSLVGKGAGGLGLLLLAWLLVKLVHVYAVMPARVEHREARSKGTLLSELVPPGENLFLYRLKDEGIMFYYGRPVRRLHAGTDRPPAGYAVLTADEWDRRPAGLKLVRRLTDEQGDPIVLVRWPPRDADTKGAGP
jgi:hypothetical protein